MKTEQEIKLLADSIEYIALHPNGNLTQDQTEHLANTHMTLQWVLGEVNDDEQRMLSIGFEGIVFNARLLREMTK